MEEKNSQYKQQREKVELKKWAVSDTYGTKLKYLPFVSSEFWNLGRRGEMSMSDCMGRGGKVFEE
jgi:hypothetical protein